MTRAARRTGVLAATSAAVAALAWAGVLPTWPGLVHAVALPPIGLFTDLRVLVTRASSYPVFVLGLLLSLAFRTVVLVVLLGPPTRDAAVRAARFQLSMSVPAFVAAALLSSSLAALGSPLFWMGMAVVVALFVAAAVPWRGWRLAPATSLTYFAGAALLGAAADLTAPVLRPLWLVPSAALSYGMLRLFEEGTVPFVAARRLLAAVVVVTVAAGAWSVLAQPTTPPRGGDAARPGSLFVMSGMNSASGEGAIFEVDPGTLGFTCERTFYYSYEGVGRGAPQGNAFCPITTGAPYTDPDTVRPLTALAETFRRQVEALPPPVTVLAHSQGAWVAWAALADGDRRGVRNLVLIGPFLDTPMAYPPPGQEGAGRIGVDALRALLQLQPQPAYHPYTPLTLELFARPGAAEALFSMPVPDGVAVLSATSLLDHPIMPDGWRFEPAVNACPVPIPHGNLPFSHELIRAVDRWLDGRELEPCPLWRRVVGPPGRSFNAPPG